MTEGRAVGGQWKGKGIKKGKLVATNSHRIVKYSIGNVVNNVVMTVHGARWVLDLLGEITLYIS